MIIIWTDTALVSLKKIILFLGENWTEKGIEKFKQDIEKTLDGIKQSPLMYQGYKDKDDNIRRGFVNRIISVYYEVDFSENIIRLLTFFDNRQNPRNLKYLLKI